MENRSRIDDVRDQYANVARGDLTNDISAVRSIASAFGYTEDDLNQLPAEANMGLSCGNPLAIAGLREGEVVVDLGCGGGMDAFLAARRVGPTGKVIGVDMTAEMLERARAGKQKLGLTNVEFIQSTVDRLPLADQSVDCVISNCVVNLVPEKLAVFREILRVLKPGGRVALSDIALRKELPRAVMQSVEAYVGCISGAIQISEYRSLMEKAGFQNIVVTDVGADLNAYATASSNTCCDGGICNSPVEKPDPSFESPSIHDGLSSLFQSFDANAYAASVRVHAIKQPSIPAIVPLSVLPLRPATASRNSANVQVFDKPMCCSTGVCGPNIDPVLPRFAADLEWLKSQGHHIVRFNLAQQPQAFIENKLVHQLLSTVGTDCLPIVMVNGEVVSQTVYPGRDDFLNWIQGTTQQNPSPNATAGAGCCGSRDCC